MGLKRSSLLHNRNVFIGLLYARISLEMLFLNYNYSPMGPYKYFLRNMGQHLGQVIITKLHLMSNCMLSKSKQFNSRYHECGNNMLLVL